MASKHSDFILPRVRRYYAEKLRAHGATPAGVDWNSESSQRLRFEKLLAVAGDANDFSVTDYGCGYGALVEFLRASGRNVRYQGFDIAEDMIAAARTRYAGCDMVVFTSDRRDLEPTDFVVASGIFNVRLDVPDKEWQQYMFDTLDEIDRLSRRGFSFNALTVHADAERMRPDLYYADPSALLRRCIRRYSRRVTLLHDYELYEFTVLVRR